MTEPDDTVLAIARQFADAVDRDDYETAARFLDNESIYQMHSRVFIGPDDILEQFRKQSEWAKSTFDAVAYESSVEHLKLDRVQVTFVDHITHGDETLHHESRQVLTIDPDNERIARIKQEDVPGEQEKVEDFLDKTDISQPLM